MGQIAETTRANRKVCIKQMGPMHGPNKIVMKRSPLDDSFIIPMKTASLLSADGFRLPLLQLKHQNSCSLVPIT